MRLASETNIDKGNYMKDNMPLPNEHNEEKYHILLHYLITKFQDNLASFLIKEVEKKLGKNWLLKYQFPNNRDYKGINSYNALWDITKVYHEIFNVEKSVFRYFYYGFNTLQQREIRECFINFKNTRNKTYHRDAIQNDETYCYILQNYLEKIIEFQKKTDINLSFKPEDILERVNDLVVGVIFEESEIERKENEKIKSELAAQEKKHKLELDEIYEKIKSQEEIISNNRAALIKKQIIESDINVLKNEKKELIQSLDDLSGRITAIDWYFNKIGFGDVSYLSDFLDEISVNKKYEIDSKYRADGIVIKYKFSLMMNNTFSNYINFRKIKYLDFNESTLAIFWRTFKKTGGKIFITENCDVFTFPERCENYDYYLYLGNVKNIIKFT